MRAAPPLAFTVSRFGTWRAVLAGIAAISAAAVLAWWSRSEVPAAGAWAAAGLACALLPIAEALRTRPQTLRWDGERWHAGPAGAGASLPGRLEVVVDAGSWLLLRFAADPDALAAARPRPFPGGGAVWVPVQRRGLEDLWHPIRCTVYSPPPGGPPRGAAAPPSE